MSNMVGQLRPRIEAAAIVCMLCERTVGRIHQGRVYAESSADAIRQEGRRLRCGYCGGCVYRDVDPVRLPRRVDEVATEAGLRRTGTA